MSKVKTIFFSRPVGYISPVTGFNKGKEQEFKMRRSYNINDIKNDLKNENK